MLSHIKNLIIATLLLSFTSPTHATMIEFMDTTAMTKTSKAIRVGKVTSKYSSWDPENRMVYTYVKLNVTETIKGEPASEVLIRIPGGEASGVKIVVHGVAHFNKGEETMVFLEHHRGAPAVAGMSQGKYMVTRDKKTGKRYVSRQLPHSLDLVSKVASSHIAHATESSTQHFEKVHADSKPIEINQMIRNVRSVMEAK